MDTEAIISRRQLAEYLGITTIKLRQFYDAGVLPQDKHTVQQATQALVRHFTNGKKHYLDADATRREKLEHETALLKYEREEVEGRLIDRSMVDELYTAKLALIARAMDDTVKTYAARVDPSNVQAGEALLRECMTDIRRKIVEAQKESNGNTD